MDKTGTCIISGEAMIFADRTALATNMRRIEEYLAKLALGTGVAQTSWVTMGRTVGYEESVVLLMPLIHKRASTA